MRNIQDTIKENNCRLEYINQVYNPETGEGCDTFTRIKICIKDYPMPVQYIPEKMYQDEPICKEVHKAGSVKEYLKRKKIPYTKLHYQEFLICFFKLRIRYDFEYFAYVCLTIEDGRNGLGDIPFKLNRGQRRLLKKLEEQRLAGKPIRIILLKSRQWGGSTLIQLYMLWIQLVHKEKWHSIICAHLDQAAKHIRGMFQRALKMYPDLSNEKYELSPYQNTQNIKEVKARGCRITVGSAESPDSVRSQTAFMIHYSEVGLFPATEGKKPEDLIGATSSVVKRIPYSMIVYESTAKGIGNFFHTQWLNATDPDKKSAFEPVFVEWFLIDMYSEAISIPYEDFINSMTDYEWMLFDKGATLEAINWYRGKSSESASESSMKEEFPSDDIEAFQNSGQPVFNVTHVERLRKDCIPPIAVGEVYGRASAASAKLKPDLRKRVLQGVSFSENNKGNLKIWDMPDNTMNISNRYVVFVDTGGRSSKADYSVATVFDRYWMMFGGKPSVVAQWRGHIDHDILVWKCAQLGVFYQNALLIFESNTHDTEKDNNTDGDHTEFIFDTIAKYYTNLYSRTPADKIVEGLPPKWGFHMNKATKAMIIDTYISILREQGYKERDNDALNEARWYEKKANGTFGNIDGKHDDILITRMGGLHVCYDLPLPKVITDNKSIKSRDILGESTI